MRALADTLDAFADAMPVLVHDAIVATTERAAEILRTTIPVDTGATRDDIRVERTGDGARLVIGTDYASFIFAKGDDFRQPVYPSLVAEAFNTAVSEVGIAAQVVDLTEAYFGQGRTTTDITGPARKMIQHAPPKEAEAWRTLHPEAIEVIVVDGQEIYLVPADVIDAGQAGVMRFG